MIAWLGLATLGCTVPGRLAPDAGPDGAPGGDLRRAPDGPYVLVLGTAQDGGLPQIGCDGAACRAARADARHGRLVASLLVVDPRTQRRFLVDATPDLPAQLERSAGHPPDRRPAGARPLPFDGIFLTHAHMGHYTGLLQLGNEAYGVQGQPVYATPRMASFLRDNGPWDLLVESGRIELRTLAPDAPVRLGDGLSITPVPVPHRDEHSDTVAFVVRGPQRALLYVPDIDKWERWDRRLEDVLAAVDVALIDGTFFDAGEVPGRDLSRIPHPFVVESLERLDALPAGERAKIFFTHLNHTNPLADPTDAQSAAARRVRDAGASVARDGQLFEL